MTDYDGLYVRQDWGGGLWEVIFFQSFFLAEQYKFCGGFMLFISLTYLLSYCPYLVGEG